MSSDGIMPESINDPEVMAFQALHSLAGPAFHVDYSDYGYDANWCHVSAKHRALVDGGRRVHGWALWSFNNVVVGDHHSIWESPKGQYADVTPPRYGANRILFLPDPNAMIEMDDEHIFFLTNRSSVAGAECMWRGDPTEFTHWQCPRTKEDLVAYCAKWDLEISSIATDEVFG